MKLESIKLLRLVLGNIVICATIAAVIAVTVSPRAEDATVKTEPYYYGKSDSSVSLMVNVYWGTEYIAPMLDIFERYDARTTFFVGGSWAVGNSDTLALIASKGHGIGNHGFYHKDHKKLNLEYNKKEIASAHDAVKSILGIDMNLFAPPSGSFGDNTLEAASSLGYRTVMWTRDTIDWRDHDEELIYSRAVKNLKGGDLILMHPTDSTVKALERILQKITEAGLTVSPVDEVLNTSDEL
ncbi:MAG: polysaccharide deacetylase family protein [Clostridiales bacterium]|nr:polysaccharide deacetylase family protein [Clostridiales bacterium]